MRTTLLDVGEIFPNLDLSPWMASLVQVCRIFSWCPHNITPRLFRLQLGGLVLSLGVRQQLFALSKHKADVSFGVP